MGLADPGPTKAAGFSSRMGDQSVLLMGNNRAASVNVRLPNNDCVSLLSWLLAIKLFGCYHVITQGVISIYWFYIPTLGQCLYSYLLERSSNASLTTVNFYIEKFNLLKILNLS